MKRPYDSSPHSDGSYIKSTGDASSDMSHIMGLKGGAEFRDVRDDFAESKVIVQNEAGVAMAGQSLFEGPCVIPVMDSLTKSSVDAFILPLQSLDAVAGPPVDSIPCFQDSKEDVPITGVYDNLYDSSVASNLVGNALARERERDLENQLSNLIEAAHQKMISSMPHEGLMQTGGLGHASLTDQLNAAQSPTEHGGGLLGGAQGENSEYGEPQSKRLASYQQANMDILIQLINADADSQKLKPKDEMNWSGMSSGDATYGMGTNSNLPPLTGSESHDVHHSSTSAQLENLSNFTLKSFDPSPPSTTSLPQQPVLFDFDSDVMQASFLQSQVTDVKPDPNFSGIDAYLHDSVRYTNSSSPQSMDTSGPAGPGLFQGDSHASLSFPIQAINDKDDKTSLFGIHLSPGAPKEPPTTVAFRTRSRTFPGSSSIGITAMSNSNNPVHMVNIRDDSGDLVGMDFRDLSHSGFGSMKASGSELHGLMESHHLPNETRAATEINQIANQNLILHHSAIHSPELTLLGVSQVADSEHHLSHIDQSMHSYSGQDQTDITKQQHYSQPGLVEVAPTHSFSDGDLQRLDKMSQYIGMDLPDMDTLLHLSNPQSSTMNSLHRLSDAPITGALHQVQIEMTGGNHLPENTAVITLSNIGPITAAGAATSADNCFTSDNGSMGSNLQQSLYELQDLKYQMGFSDGPQSPTRSGKMSSSDSTGPSEGNLSPKAEFSVSNDHTVLTPTSLSRGQPGQEALHPLSNCTSGNFGSAEMTSLQGSLNYTQTTCNTQTLQNNVSSSGPELYENIFQQFPFLSNSENLNVPMISSSNSSLETSLNNEVLLMHHSSLASSQMLTTGNDVYIGTKSGVVTNAQPPQQSMLSQSSPSQQHFLLMAQDGSPVVVPLSSVMLSSAASDTATVAVANQKANEYVASQSDQDQVTAMTMMDYKQVVRLPSGKIWWKTDRLPPNLVSACARTSESELPVASSRPVLVLSPESLKQLNSNSVQMTVGHQTVEVSNKLSPTSMDSLYSLAMSNGNGNMKFMSNSTAVPPQSVGN